MDRGIFSHVLLILIGMTIAIVVTFLGFYASFTLAENIILVFLSQILLLEANNYILSHHTRTKRSLETIQGERGAFRKSLRMQKRAKEEIYASWGFPRYTKGLERYFSRSFKLLDSRNRAGLDVKLTRLVNVNEVEIDRVKEHLTDELVLRFLRSEKYIIFSSFHRAFEYIVVDRREAMFLAPNPLRASLDMGIYGRDDPFVYCMVEHFNDMCKKGNKLAIPTTLSNEEAKEYVIQWVDSQIRHPG